MPSLKIVAEDLNPDIIAIVETNLKPEQRLELPGYILISEPRTKRSGGGLALFVHKKIAHITSTIGQSDENTLQIQVKWIKLGYGTPIYLGLFYGKQESDPKEIIMDEYLTLARQVQGFKGQHGDVLLVGDFNSKLAIPHAGQAESRNGEMMKAMINATNLVTLNLQKLCTGTWTRSVGQNQRSAIDYALCSESLIPQVSSMLIDEAGHHKACWQKTI